MRVASWVVLAASTIGLNGSTAPGVAGTNDCSPSLASYEAAWRGTGEWRRVAPVRAEQEVSPTDSIGVWLERSRTENGDVELRRVSATETQLVRAGGASCELTTARFTRTFASTDNAFTDEALRALVRENRAGVIYVWSPGMPLSIQGLDEARAAAKALGISFTPLVADASPEQLAAIHADPTTTRTMASLELVYRNANIHYPSVTFYRDGKVLGAAIPGFKSRDTYARLAREAGAGPTETPRAPITMWLDRNAKVNTVRTVQTVRRVGFFFKPIATTDVVSYTSDNASYLFDLGTRREQRIPGTVDPVPTPDGKLLTRPGLLLYPMQPLLGGDTIPRFADRELPDEYQTAAILKKSKDATRYRVVTGWRMGARLRDYDVTFDRDGTTLHVQPLGAPMTPCPDRMFSLPISAKGDSREMGAYDTKSRTNIVFQVTDEGKCVDVLDLGFASGKLSFSYDNAAIAFSTSRVNTDAEGQLLKVEELFYKDAFVLYRKNGRLVNLSANRPLSAMTFPEFLPDGRVMILDQASRFRATEAFRVVDVK